jgi:hypothetical protein
LKSLEKISKNTAKKETKKRQKKQEDNIEEAMCFLFFCAVVVCDYLGVQARVSTIV